MTATGAAFGRFLACSRWKSVCQLMDAAPIKVLLADDDELFLESLKALIDRQPELSVVAAARNGLEAIELADALETDAAVVDLHMPLLDGVTAVARLRRDHPSLCLIVLTGDSDATLHARGRARRARTRCSRSTSWRGGSSTGSRARGRRPS